VAGGAAETGIYATVQLWSLTFSPCLPGVARDRASGANCWNLERSPTTLVGAMAVAAMAGSSGGDGEAACRGQNRIV